MAAIVQSVAGVSSWNGRTGTVTFTTADITGAGGATSAQLGNYLPLSGGTVSGNLTVSGTTTLASGNLLVDGGGSLTTNGNITAQQNVRANASLIAGSGTVYAGDPSAACYLQNSGTSRNLVFWPNYYLDFNGSNGYLYWVSPNGAVLSINPGGNLNATGGITCGAYGVVYSNYGGNQIGFQWTSGTVRVHVDNTNQGILYTTLNPPPSDGRIKDVLGRYRDGLDAIMKLSPVWFKWKGNDPAYEADDIERVGLIAQDIEKGEFGFAVKQTRGTIDGKEVDDRRGLDPTQLIWAMINAFKEVDVRLRRLESTHGA